MTRVLLICLGLVLSACSNVPQDVSAPLVLDESPAPIEDAILVETSPVAKRSSVSETCQTSDDGIGGTGCHDE
ncbi:MAG: hypothetical protein ABJL99_13695 [Aliishimia sp.]